MRKEMQVGGEEAPGSPMGHQKCRGAGWKRIPRHEAE